MFACVIQYQGPRSLGRAYSCEHPCWPNADRKEISICPIELTLMVLWSAAIRELSVHGWRAGATLLAPSFRRAQHATGRKSVGRSCRERASELAIQLRGRSTGGRGEPPVAGVILDGCVGRQLSTFEKINSHAVDSRYFLSSLLSSLTPSDDPSDRPKPVVDVWLMLPFRSAQTHALCVRQASIHTADVCEWTGNSIRASVLSV